MDRWRGEGRINSFMWMILSADVGGRGRRPTLVLLQLNKIDRRKYQKDRKYRGMKEKGKEETSKLYEVDQ